MWILTYQVSSFSITVTIFLQGGGVEGILPLQNEPLKGQPGLGLNTSSMSQ